MKKHVLYFILALALPVIFHFGAMAQEGAAGSGGAAVEKSEGVKTDVSSRRDAEPSGAGDTSVVDSAAKKGETGTGASETAKKAERKKKEARKQPEKKAEEKKEAPAREEEKEADIDRESGDSLLMIDHEKIKDNRIPGITIKKEEPGEDLVKVSDDKISDVSKEEKKSEGIFGKRTKTIAGWAIVIFIFILFAIYSKTRSKKRRRGTVRTITKR